MKKDLRRIVSAAVCAICTLAAGVCFAMTTMSARTGSTWEVEGFDRVFYQSDNHDSCKLYQKKDGKFCILLTKPGTAIIRVYYYQGKDLFAEDFRLDIEGEAVDPQDIIYAINNPTSTTQQVSANQNISYPNIFPRKYYDGLIGQNVSTDSHGIVPLSQLSNYQLLHWNLTDEQLNACYNAVKPFVASIVGLPREEQMRKIAVELREFFEGRMEYSTKAPHFLDAYGFFILKKASCQGSTAATGLCLNMLGIPYEHVNHNKWTHQWCRAKIGEQYWIVDPYGLYCGPEPSPYEHPINR